MTDDATRYVICYDVPDDKRRASLAKLLDAYGDRVQYSIFEAVLDRALFDKMRQQAAKLINLEEDRLAIYPLCAACARKSWRVGQGSDEAPGEEIVFIV
ncbi:MAG: CRISPR-associated endonuclease Cas2 [Candidatus Tectomicrobia bacterium]|nr:CRISPR-associated endonuclease Cas2 [Candidatus Tectomicrobia bacterium]